METNFDRDTSCELLHCASDNGTPSMVTELLHRGADPNYQRACQKNQTSLHLFARTANVEGMTCLFSVCGTSLQLNLLDSNGNGGGGFDAVYYAVVGPVHPVIHLGMPSKCQGRYVATLRCMKDIGGMDVEYLVRNGSRTPSIVQAAQHGSKCTKIVKFLLDIGADPNARSTRFGGQTALHAAVAKGSLTTVKLLLRAGANTLLRLIPHGYSGCNGMDSLAVEGSSISMDMRSADFIFRWEEKHDIVHEERDFSQLTGGLTYIRNCVKVFRETGDPTGGLGDLDMVDIQTGVRPEEEVELMLTEEEQTAVQNHLRFLNRKTGATEFDLAAIVNSPDARKFLPDSFLQKFKEMQATCKAAIPKGKDQSKQVKANQQSMREKIKRAEEKGKVCAWCGIKGIGSQLKKCSRCKMVYYCSKEHQVAAWKRHKKECKKI